LGKKQTAVGTDYHQLWRVSHVFKQALAGATAPDREKIQ